MNERGLSLCLVDTLYIWELIITITIKVEERPYVPEQSIDPIHDWSRYKGRQSLSKPCLALADLGRNV